jgi:hypothetical protein
MNSKTMLRLTTSAMKRLDARLQIRNLILPALATNMGSTWQARNQSKWIEENSFNCYSDEQLVAFTLP